MGQRAPGSLGQTFGRSNAFMTKPTPPLAVNDDDKDDMTAEVQSALECCALPFSYYDKRRRVLSPVVTSHGKRSPDSAARLTFFLSIFKIFVLALAG